MVKKLPQSFGAERHTPARVTERVDYLRSRKSRCFLRRQFHRRPAIQAYGSDPNLPDSCSSRQRHWPKYPILFTRPTRGRFVPDAISAYHNRSKSAKNVACVSIRNFRFSFQQPHTIYPSRDSSAISIFFGRAQGAAQGSDCQRESRNC